MVHHDVCVNRRIIPRAAGFLTAHFSCLWCACYVALILVALAEVIVLRQCGVEGAPWFSSRRVSVGDVCVSKDNRWAAVQMSFRCQDSAGRIINDVVTYDLQRETKERLHLEQYRPRCVSISPTDQSIAIASDDNSIYVWNRPLARATGGDPSTGLRFLGRVGDEGIQRLIFSPDGRKLAVFGRQFIHLLRYADGKLCLRLANDDTSSLAFSRDSRRLVLLGRDGTVRRWDTSSCQQIGSRAWVAQSVIRTALAADGRLAAFVCADGSLSVWSLESGKQLWRHGDSSPDEHVAQAVEFSPRGSLLVHVGWTCQQYRISCFDGLTGQSLGQSLHCVAVFKGIVAGSDDAVYSWDRMGVIRRGGPETGFRELCPISIRDRK